MADRNGAPPRNDNLSHNPSYEEPARIERVSDRRSRSKVGLFAAVGAALVALVAGVTWFGGEATEEVRTASLKPTSEANREAVDLATSPEADGARIVEPAGDGDAAVPARGNAAVVADPGGGAALVTGDGDDGVEVVTVPNQVTPKFAAGEDAAYVETESGLRTVVPADEPRPEAATDAVAVPSAETPVAPLAVE